MEAFDSLLNLWSMLVESGAFLSLWWLDKKKRKEVGQAAESVLDRTGVGMLRRSEIARKEADRESDRLERRRALLLTQERDRRRRERQRRITTAQAASRRRAAVYNQPSTLLTSNLGTIGSTNRASKTILGS